ncbi:MAG: DUF4349 domain-containing protein [Gemmatimonadaceae bacterium]
MLLRRLSLTALLLASVACSARMATRSRPPVGPVDQPLSEVAVGQARPASVDARLLVRRAAMDVVVDDVARTAARAQSILVGANGYVERGERSERSASFTIRVPEASLDAVLDSLATLGKVASRTVSAEDVTEESIDLDARLQALIATRDRLKQLLERASTITDVMTVEREVARVQGEVDSLQGHLKHLRGSAVMASVELSVRRKIVLGPLGYVAQGIGTLLAKLFVIR